jgi:surfeit locus 1 family protein
VKRWALVALTALGAAGLVSLGVWQLERREWKLALIERVEQRVHAAPVAAPPPSEWPALSRDSAEYSRVAVTGRFLPVRSTFVRAVTELGGGYWVMAPFRTDLGFVVLINRGFVTPEQRQAVVHAAGIETLAGSDAADDYGASAGAVTPLIGLVRMSEPNGGFLRANVPADDRWYSRDVAAIFGARQLPRAAPYFIDAEASAAADGEPVGGLTVIAFRNGHLVYAITWFTLALMMAALGVRMARHRKT